MRLTASNGEFSSRKQILLNMKKKFFDLKNTIKLNQVKIEMSAETNICAYLLQEVPHQTLNYFVIIALKSQKCVNVGVMWLN